MLWLTRSRRAMSRMETEVDASVVGPGPGGWSEKGGREEPKRALDGGGGDDSGMAGLPDANGVLDGVLGTGWGWGETRSVAFDLGRGFEGMAQTGETGVVDGGRMRAGLCASPGGGGDTPRGACDVHPYIRHG